MDQPNRIMAAVDLSPQSQTIVDHACELAKQSEAEVHLVHVEAGGKESNKETTQLGLEQLGLLMRPAAELETSTEKSILYGIPHRALVSYAESHGIKLIIMGTHGRKGLSHMALGSVAERVVRDAPCPVQVLKSPRHAAPELDEVTSALDETLSDELSGNRTETERHVRQAIADQFNVSIATAKDIFERLKQHGWVTWVAQDESSGRWSFVTGIEFAQMAGDLKTSSSNSQAAELIARAQRLRATDIHVDPVDNTESRVRLRIDGKLAEYCVLSRDVADHLTNQWKMMAGLDIAEPFKPKEGRVVFPSSAVELRDLEARLTTVPVAGGDAVAIRLFSHDKVFIPLSELGLSTVSLSAVDEALGRSEGLILVTGPTGVGKTTTVYSMLEAISSAGINIVSIEDPVEFSVPFVRQMEVNERHGITMTDGLKTMLRMDPDVVFLGEIRDSVAAQIAVRAASSGRYVFTTLHTRDVASVVTALRDLGLPDRSLAANISGIVNQRLLRRLCMDCRRPVELSTKARTLFEQHSVTAPDQLYETVGCSTCRQTGYLGRVGVFEAVSVNAQTRSSIAAGITEGELRNLLRDKGVASLNTDVMTKVAEGITDLKEAMLVSFLA